CGALARQFRKASIRASRVHTLVHLHLVGFKGVLKYLDEGTLALELHGHDIEPARAQPDMIARQILFRQSREAAALEPRYRLGRLAELAPSPGLDLDEHQRRAIPRDNVQFAASAPVSAGKNCVPATLEFLAREIFADFAEDDARAAQGAWTSSKSFATVSGGR